MPSEFDLGYVHANATAVEWQTSASRKVGALRMPRSCLRLATMTPLAGKRMLSLASPGQTARTPRAFRPSGFVIFIFLLPAGISFF